MADSFASFNPDDQAGDPGPLAVELLPTNEREYIIPAQDSKGHNIRLYCRAMPAVGRMVADVHASRKYPFRTSGDLVRWCVAYGVKRLASAAGIPSVMAQADAMIAICQDEEFQLQFLEYFNSVKQVVDRYIEMGAPGEARRIVAQAQANIANMPDSWWKRRYEQNLLDRFGALLDAAGVTPGSWDVTALEPAQEANA